MKSIYLSPWVEHLITEYLRECGLEPLLRRQIEALPVELARRLGEDAETWRERLSSPSSVLHRINLLDGSIEKAVNQAIDLSEKHNKSLCEYLEMALKRKWIENYLVGYIRSMLPIKR